MQQQRWKCEEIISEREEVDKDGSVNVEIVLEWVGGWRGMNG